MDESGHLKRNRPLVIGITGNIGTGKSTVARMLADLGAEVIDADVVAHTVMRPGTRAYDQVLNTFGPEILRPDGSINRIRLGMIVFQDPAALRRLETIVHPPTIHAIQHLIAASSAQVVAVEAIKLIEAGMADDCDSVWVVICEKEQQVQRVMNRGLSKSEAMQRIQAQPPQETKVVRADIVIDNSGSIAETRFQVRAAWQRMLSTGADQ
jgi:dephospho-CoA kinase